MVTFTLLRVHFWSLKTEDTILDLQEDEVNCECLGDFGFPEKCCDLTEFFLCFQGYSESPDLEFEYADTDKWAAELSGKGLVMDQLISHDFLSW